MTAELTLKFFIVVLFVGLSVWSFLLILSDPRPKFCQECQPEDGEEDPMECSPEQVRECAREYRKRRAQP